MTTWLVLCISCFIFITNARAQQSASTSQATSEAVVRVEIVSPVGSQNGSDLSVDLTPGSQAQSSNKGNSSSTQTSQTKSGNSTSASQSSSDSTGTSDTTRANSQNQKNSSSKSSTSNKNSTTKTTSSANTGNDAAADSLVTLNIPQTSPNAGWLQITGPQNQTVIMTVQAPDSLVNGNGNVIPFQAKEAYNSKAAQASKANPYGKNKTKNVQLNDKVGGSSGAAYLWVYGNLKVSAPKPGSYVGVFQVTVTY